MRNTIIKDIGFITLARVLVIACQIVNIKLYTNFIEIEELGFYFFLLTVSYFTNALVFGPIDYYYQANLAKIIKSSGGIMPFVLFSRKLAALFSIVVLLFAIILSLIKPQFVAQFILAAALSITLFVVQALRNTLNNLEYKRDMPFSLALEAVLKVAFFLILLNITQPDSVTLLIAWLGALLVNVIFLALRTSYHGLFVFKESVTLSANNAFIFSYPISISAICNWIQLQGYRLVLVPFGYAEIVGVYATIASIGSAGMAAAGTVFSQAFSPRIYKSSGQYTSRYLRNSLALIGVILCISILFGRLIIDIATSPTFATFWPIIIFGVLTDATNLLIGALGVHITLNDNTKKIMNSAAIGVVIFVIGFGLLLLFERLTVYTIGIPLVVSQFAVITHLYWNHKKCKPS